MRLLAYPAALVLAFVLYLSCPKLAPLVLSLPKKILPLLTKLDQKFSRPPYSVSYPVYLLLFFLVGLLLSLIHPAVSAVTMALPLFGLAPIPACGAVKRELDSGAFEKDIPAYEAKVRNTCAALVPEFVAHLCAPLLLMALGMPLQIGSALGWAYLALCSSCAEIPKADQLLGSIVHAADQVFSALLVLCSGVVGRNPFRTGGHGAQNRLMNILGITDDDHATHAPVSGDISQAAFLCCFCICLLCLMLTLVLIPFVHAG